MQHPAGDRAKPPVASGLDRLVAERFARLRGRRVGLVTHPAAVDARLRDAASLFTAAPDVTLVAIFGPEHGFSGQAQDLESVPEDAAPALSVRVHSLYGTSAASLRPTPEQLAGIDLLVIDLQDVGSRYYTFQATMKYCLEAAAPLGLPVLVLDRPNPLGGTVVEGPRLQPGYESFVGCHDIAIRHGLTIGELALVYQADLDAAGTQVEVEVLPCGGWRRGMWFDETGLPWVLPSPNMPTLDTAVVYPGQCLLEGTNLSEGRGTTRPFELCGAPWLDPATLAARMNAANLPGVVFRPVVFRPTFQKHAGIDCGGVQLHVTDREAFRPVRTSLALLIEMRRLAPDRFAWRTAEYEFVKDPIAIDLLFGSDRERTAIEAGRAWQEIAAAWSAEEEAFSLRRHHAWLYE
ncbi:MAG: exo-beta-N-acetylmuramidase NamZ domain-containing protein [Planctomycetota bacterium]